MSQETNVSQTNQSAESVSTTDYFNNVGLPAVHTSQNIDDAIVGYFEQIAENETAARAMAGAVIMTARSQGVDPMATLAEFSKLKSSDLNAYTTMFLNLSRKGTSYLGINNSPDMPKYVKRMILP